MAIVKCQNPQCDYFHKPVPEGDFCPFCGEALGNVKLSPPLPSPQEAPHLENYSPQLIQPSYQPPSAQPQPPTNPPVVYQPQPVQPAYQPQPVQPQPTPPVTYKAPPDATVVEAFVPLHPALKLIHTSGKEFAMYGQRAYIGRRGGDKKPQPEIDLTDLPYSERVSRPHAHIVWDERSKGYIIVDDRSANGTILDGTILTPLQPYPLTNGAQLEFGREHMIKFMVQID